MDKRYSKNGAVKIVTSAHFLSTKIIQERVLGYFENYPYVKIRLQRITMKCLLYMKIRVLVRKSFEEGLIWGFLDSLSHRF